jgi:hypothetical protein
VGGAIEDAAEAVDDAIPDITLQDIADAPSDAVDAVEDAAEDVADFFGF